MRWILMLVLSLLSGCSGSESSRTIEGATREAALAWSPDVYLPQIAANVYGYEKVGGLQDLERFYRFAVPAADIEAAVEYVTETCEKRMNRHYTFEKTSTLSSTYNWPSWAKSTLAWWQPDLIGSGFYKGTLEGYGVRIWADARSGTIFVYQND